MANQFGPGDHNIHLRHGFSGVASPYNASELGENRAFSNYPPPHNESNPSFYTSQTNLTKDKDGAVAIAVSTPRTPSPTPSENALLSRKGVIDWKKMMGWRFWVRREWLCESGSMNCVTTRYQKSHRLLGYYVILAIILIIFALISIYDRQIVNWLQPEADKIKKHVPFLLVNVPRYSNHVSIASLQDGRFL